MRAYPGILFRKNVLNLLGVGVLSLHLAAAQDDCTIRIVIDDGGEGEGEGEGEYIDSDGDGLLDVDERAFGTDSRNPDSDFDGLLDGSEAWCAIPVALEAPREDGSADAAAVWAGCCTDPLNADSDFDGIPDGADSCDAIEWIDSDGDGLQDADERAIGTDPFNADSDFDGLIDSDELWCVGTTVREGAPDGGAEDAPVAFTNCCTDPLNADSDYDGIPDGADTCDAIEWIDSDGDGLQDADEQAIGTDPFNVDSDGDGLLDGNEVYCIGDVVSPPLTEDTTHDDATGCEPVEPAPACCTDPLNVDSDADGVRDGEDTCDVDSGRDDGGTSDDLQR
jgi:hypothetical protein